MKASQQAIERGVKDCLFIDYKRRSGHFDVTTVASIKEIIEKDCHCLIDIAPHAIERLHSVNIYPIIIFIRYKNAKQIKEQKDPVYLRDKVSQKHSKEQFEAAQKMEQEYSKYFTGVVQGGPLSSICTQVMAVVEQEQNKPLWLPDAWTVRDDSSSAAAQCSVGHPLVLHQWTQDAAPQDAAHRTLPTGSCPTGRCPTRCCPTRRCPTGRCPQEAAPQDAALLDAAPLDAAPQDAAHRKLPHRTLPY
ncbi:hypothetical protein NFI96_030570 [Prochilodus magdalenae]|nr:hypothetical protein NFI96_030570 [Prochilodus magdalenae]